MFDRIQTFRRKPIVQTISFWASRVLIVLLSLALWATDFGSLTRSLSKPANAVLLLAIAFNIWVVYAMLYKPIRELRAMNKEQARVFGDAPDIALMSHQSVEFIPSTVPEEMRISVIWHAEMKGDVSQAGIEAAAEFVTARYRSGLSHADVADELAVHEAGHATVSLALGRAVVAIERNGGAGFTYSLNQVASPRAEDIWADLVVTVAGAQAEKLWSKYNLLYPNDGHDDRATSTEYIHALLFAGWTPDDSVVLGFDSILFAAQEEARRILNDYQPLHDELRKLVASSEFVGSEPILALAKKYVPFAISD